jgi:Protein of unknown function (DUF4240)
MKPLLGETLAQNLARQPIPRVCRFQRALMDLAEQALTWELWHAADIVFHPWGVSTDGFVYFRLWLIGARTGDVRSGLARPGLLGRERVYSTVRGRRRW